MHNRNCVRTKNMWLVCLKLFNIMTTAAINSVWEMRYYLEFLLSQYAIPVVQYTVVNNNITVLYIEFLRQLAVYIYTTLQVKDMGNYHYIQT